MMRFGALNYFGSVINKLKKIIVLYQPRDLHVLQVILVQPKLESLHPVNKVEKVQHSAARFLTNHHRRIPLEGKTIISLVYQVS